MRTDEKSQKIDSFLDKTLNSNECSLPREDNDEDNQGSNATLESTNEAKIIIKLFYAIYIYNSL